MRSFKEVPGGYYDSEGFYVLPDGSFYDPDGYFFDKQGYDEFGGYYDDSGCYVPGEKNKEEFRDIYGQEEVEDDLIKQFEIGETIEVKESDAEQRLF